MNSNLMVLYSSGRLVYVCKPTQCYHKKRYTNRNNFGITKNIEDPKLLLFYVIGILPYTTSILKFVKTKTISE